MQTHFEEQQYFRQWWIWLLLLGINAAILYAFVRDVFLQGATTAKMTDIVMLSLLLFLTLSASILLWIVRLETKMDEHTLAYRWYPMIKEYKSIPWPRIRKHELIQYGYIGYGTRYCVQYGIIHNVGGNKGLQIVTNQDKRLLIGTQKPKELINFLSGIGKL